MFRKIKSIIAPVLLSRSKRKPIHQGSVKSTIKEYVVPGPEELAIIRELFSGFIHRRTEDGICYVMCSEIQKKIIENSGNKITLTPVQ